MVDVAAFSDIIARALAEDIGGGDITSELLIDKNAQAQMALVAREGMVACGTFIPALVFGRFDKNINVEIITPEGKNAARNTTLVIAHGNARTLLTGERVALNVMQRMCGIATLTQRYVEAIKDTKAVLLDTRKTMPNLRVLDKYSVTVGGGKNHRMRLDDMVLIKDNHIALSGNIAAAVAKARAGTTLPIVVECDTLAQVEEALAAKPDRILLDNMSNDMLRSAVTLSGGKIPLEASGGVSLATIGDIARTGVDFISVGKLTHSVPACDIGADIIFS